MTTAMWGRARSSPSPSCWAARCASPWVGAALQAGEAEIQIRRGLEARAVPLEGAAEAVAELWQGLP